MIISAKMYVVVSAHKYITNVTCFHFHLANITTHDNIPQNEPVVFIVVSVEHMYCFEGKDYSKDPSSEDQKSFDRLL